MIRKVKNNDSDKLKELFNTKHENMACKFIHPDIHETKIDTFVYEENAEFKGMVVVSAVKYSTNPYGTIEELIVKEATNEGKVAKFLLNKATDWFNSHKIKRIFIFAREEDKKILEAMGFHKSDMVLYHKEI